MPHLANSSFPSVVPGQVDMEQSRNISFTCITIVSITYTYTTYKY